MTDNDFNLTDLMSDDSRRSFLKKGAATTGIAALGLSGTAAAQQDGDGVFDEAEAQEQEQFTAAMFSTAFRPGGRFIITSPVIDWTPDVEQNIAGRFAAFNTRVIQYVDTNEQVLFFQAQDAEVPQYDPELGYVPDDDEEFGEGEFVQPQVYTFGWDQEVFGGQNRSGLIAVSAAPLQEDEEEELFDDFNQEEDTGDDGGIFF